MISEDEKFILCDGPNCAEKIKNNYWAKVNASDWFHAKNGKSYCPKHVPDWVFSWRERRKGK